MAASFLLPTLGAAGLFTLKAPFDAKLLPTTKYTLVSIRKLTEIIAAGGDPFTDYYASVNIDKSYYTSDLAAGVVILSLQAADSSIVNVPNSYLAAYPSGGSIPYTSMVMAIKLGPIADSVDLSYMGQQAESLVMATLGISSTVTMVAVSNTSLLTLDDHNRIEAARQQIITGTPTDRALLLAAQQQRDAALAKITELENYIISQQSGSTTPPATGP